MYSFPCVLVDTAPPSDLLSTFDPILSYAWVGLAFLVGFTIYMTRPNHPYASIPAIGRTGFFSSYLDTIRVLRDANPVLQEGYLKYKPGIFRIPLINYWHIIVCGEKLIEEIRGAPDDVLSTENITKEALSLRYTIGHKFASDMYHIGVIRSQLTRNIGNVFPEIRDELVTSFEDNIPMTDDWTSFKASDTVIKIFNQTTNRVFVGVPTCREPEYLKLTIHFIDIMQGALAMNLLPDILKPAVGYLFSPVPRAVRTCLKYLGPIIEERQRKIDEYGPNYPDKPNDLLSWLMDETQGKQLPVEDLVLRVLFVNFVGIDTSSTSFTIALLRLAASPEYIQPIREEIESVIAESGWNKVAMTRMRKLDSFLKESQRIYGFTSLTMARKAVKEFTFSDGTRIPKGGMVSTAPLAIHMDDDRYSNSKEFDGFRFSNIRDGEGEGTKNQMVATNPNYLPFGHGKRACPGRFFAVNVLKAMMAHLILTYDIKLTDDEVLAAKWPRFICRPDPKAEVLFRRRRI